MKTHQECIKINLIFNITLYKSSLNSFFLQPCKEETQVFHDRLKALFIKYNFSTKKKKNRICVIPQIFVIVKKLLVLYISISDQQISQNWIWTSWYTLQQVEQKKTTYFLAKLLECHTPQ